MAEETGRRTEAAALLFASCTFLATMAHSESVMNDPQREALAAAVGRPAATLSIEPVELPGAADCGIVRVTTGETGPPGTVYAIRASETWLTARQVGALDRALASCGEASAATLAQLVTLFAPEARGYAALSEPRPGFVSRKLEAAGWAFHPPRLEREGAHRRLEFLSLGPDGEGVARIVADWTHGSSAKATVRVERPCR